MPPAPIRPAATCCFRPEPLPSMAPPYLPVTLSLQSARQRTSEGAAPMHGLMQHDELVLTRILERAQMFHPRQQIVTKTAHGIDRESYEDMAERAARLAN